MFKFSSGKESCSTGLFAYSSTPHLLPNIAAAQWDKAPSSPEKEPREGDNAGLKAQVWNASRLNALLWNGFPVRLLWAVNLPMPFARVAYLKYRLTEVEGFNGHSSTDLLSAAMDQVPQVPTTAAAHLRNGSESASHSRAAWHGWNSNKSDVPC